MRLWTYQPVEFQVDAADLVIDSTKGQYWHYAEPGFRYREVLPKLHGIVGTSQFLWCFTIPGERKGIDGYEEFEWELNVPVSRVQLFDALLWEKIVRSKSDDWDSLLVPHTAAPAKEIHALAFLPLDPVWVKCCGKVPPQFPKRIRDAAQRIVDAQKGQLSQPSDEW